jgi:hypothetical protein
VAGAAADGEEAVSRLWRWMRRVPSLLPFGLFVLLWLPTRCLPEHPPRLAALRGADDGTAGVVRPHRPAARAGGVSHALGRRAGGAVSMRDNIAGALLVAILVVIPLVACVLLAMAR